MSHSRLREESNCLNCNTEVIGRYCHVCGQENVDPRESFWSLVTHFFNDITHFDGKFFATLGNLVRRPGLLPKEYVSGRRARYLHPIRMYVFTSALFFLVFYNYTGDFMSRTGEGIDVELKKDSIDGRVNDAQNVVVFGNKYHDVRAYDSAQRALPKEQRDGWLQRMVKRRVISMSDTYRYNLKGLVRDMGNGFIHSLPTLLFVSLPIFAFFLKLFYSRKNFLYADHAIYLIFLYIFSFMVMLIYIGIDKLQDLTGWGWLSWVLFGLFCYGLIYNYLGMRRFYGQGRGKTLLKYFTFNILSTAMLLVLFVLFLLLTFFRV